MWRDIEAKSQSERRKGKLERKRGRAKKGLGRTLQKSSEHSLSPLEKDTILGKDEKKGRRGRIRAPSPSSPPIIKVSLTYNAVEERSKETTDQGAKTQSLKTAGWREVIRRTIH